MPRDEGQSLQSIAWSKKFLVAYLYFIQGVFLNMPSTLTLTYQRIPSYQILGLFSMTLLPFSFKFITAPLIEKYSSTHYGRRKTWLVISLLIAGSLLLVASGLSENEQDQAVLAIMMTVVVFSISIEDICTDGLAIKELKSSETASYLQLVWQLVGGVFGSLFFLELTSADSSLLRFGVATPVIHVSQFLRAVAVITLLSGILIHLGYVETTLEEQKEDTHTLIEVVKHYRYFLNPRYRMCRQALTNLLAVHGLIYFISSYPIELIKMSIISKENLTAMSNVLIIPVLLVTHIISHYLTQSSKVHKHIRVMLSLRLAVTVITFCLNINERVPALFVISLMQLFSNAHFFFNSIIANEISNSKFAGMYVTMMASSINLGNNATIQLELIDRFGSYNCTLFGCVYTVLVVLFFGRIEAWIKRGQLPLHNAKQQ